MFDDDLSYWTKKAYEDGAAAGAAKAEKTLRERLATWLKSEATRFQAASDDAVIDAGCECAKSERLQAQASIARTFAAQVARGDDMIP